MKPETNCQYRNDCVVFDRYEASCSRDENDCPIAEEYRRTKEYWERMFSQAERLTKESKIVGML